MNDWGGPVGLDFARRHPERVKRLVIANTWCWPVGDDFHFKSFSFLMSTRTTLLPDPRRRVLPLAHGTGPLAAFPPRWPYPPTPARAALVRAAKGLALAASPLPQPPAFGYPLHKTLPTGGHVLIDHRDGED